MNLPLLVLALTGCFRGTWWYQDNGAVADAYDLLDHFGPSPTFTDAEILAIMDGCEIRLMYGSYGTLPITEPAKIDAWNGFLHKNKKLSHTVMGTLSHLADPGPLLVQIDERLVDYHGVSSVSGRFDALHLDIEPQQDPVCKMGDPLQDPVACHDLVVQLLTTVTAARNHLDTHLPLVELYADLFHDWDDVSGARVAWPATPTPEDARDAWFDAFAAQVDGVTIMAYGSSNFVTTAAKASWEWANMATDVRIATRTEDYGGDLVAMDAAAHELWVGTAENFLVDLHDFNEIFEGGGCPP